MTATFRNVAVDRTGPIDQWPFEAIVTMIERGSVTDWTLLVRSISREPWGPIARQVEEYLEHEAPYGVPPLLRRAVATARADAERRERDAVADELAQLIDASGLTITELASRVGMSRSRLPTYRSGRVMPSAGMMVRLRETVSRLADAHHA